MIYRDPIFNQVPTPLSVVVEVGTWCGGWPHRLLANVYADYTVYCIDSWEGSKGPTCHKEFQRVLAEPLAAGKVIEIWKRSDVAAQEFSLPIDTIYIDGDHFDLLTDLRAWIPHVRAGGLVIGHDFSGHKQSPHIQQALSTYFGGRVCYRSGPVVGRSVSAAGRIHSFWFFKRSPYGEQETAE